MPAKSDPSIVIPQFDVVSVKPAKDSMTRMQFTPDGLRGTGVTVRFLLYEGYGGINNEQVLNEPGWTNTDGFDVEAKVAPADVPTLGKMSFEQRRTMFQSILADRFKLVVHHETRELPIYDLVLAKGGAKFQPSTYEGTTVNTGRSRMHIAGSDDTITLLARELAQSQGRVVVNQTGLTGRYDLTLRWTPDDAPPPLLNGAPDSNAPPGLFTAIQEQLGLKLESAKGPVEVLIIDKINQPSAN